MEKNFYEGWAGALQVASKYKTQISMPTKLELDQSAGNQEKITITLTSASDMVNYYYG